MIRILQIESASKNCSVAISEDGVTCAVKELNADQFVHSEKLHVFIREIMTEEQLKFTDLHAISVSKGPGSYTGLRIGVSAAKGLCFALNIPLISLSSLEVLAAPLVAKVDGMIVPMLDARRMEVYQCIFNTEGEELEEISALVLDENTYADMANNSALHFIGDGSVKLKEIFQHENANYHKQMYPSAIDMSTSSYRKFLDNDFEDVAYFEPFYLKDFVAGKPKKLL